MCDRVERVQTLPRMLLCILVAFVVASFPVTTRAQGAREYLNTPVGPSGFIDFSFGRSQSAASADLSLPNDLSVSRVIAPYFLYSFSQHKKYGAVSLSTPLSRVKDADGNERTLGFADPNIGLHWNIFGLPALKREEMATFVPGNLVSVHLNVTVPLGSYDRNETANVGANRWSFSPLVNLNITPDKGVSWFEVYLAGKFYTDNNEFRGNNKLSQKPLVTLTGHYSHNIGKKSWASIGTSYDYGGESSINGVPQDNKAHGFRPIVAFNRKVGRFSITVRYENTATRTTEHDRNGLIGIRVATLLF